MAFEITSDALSCDLAADVCSDIELIERCVSFSFADCDIDLLPFWFESSVTQASTVASTSSALVAYPVRIHRRSKMAVSDDVKRTAAYLERRRKNTNAAKRNRDINRALADQDELPELKKINVALCAERDRLLARIEIQRSNLFMADNVSV